MRNHTNQALQTQREFSIEVHKLIKESSHRLHLERMPSNKAERQPEAKESHGHILEVDTPISISCGYLPNALRWTHWQRLML
jgi:hypothetical protein